MRSGKWQRRATSTGGPPSCPGEALTSPATLSTKHSSGFSAGTGRDPQSIVFLQNVSTTQLDLGSSWNYVQTRANLTALAPFARRPA